jgi:hypothetical protein
MKSPRQQFWLEKGYTKEQIEYHLKFERYKSKQSREKGKANNLKNKDIIEKMKSEVLNKQFGDKKVISIRPTTDGKGFWYKINRKFKDGSSGDFRYFMFFEDYSVDNILEF